MDGRGLAGMRGGAHTAARVARNAARRAGGRVRRITHAGGAGESGLGKVIELQAVHSAGDAIVAVSLAGTLFFNVPLGEARGQVALYLLITMAPFAVVAPLIGPLLDRLRHGRRWALAAAMLVRAFLVWVMADAVNGGLALYPAAFGVLVASKAHGVLRAALVPRVLPASTSLVRANARVSLAGTVAMLVAGPIGVGIAVIGPQWSLRLAFLIFGFGMVLALRLPSQVDTPAADFASPASADQMADYADEPARAPRRDRISEIIKRRGERNGSAAVVMATRANAAIRAFSGFLIIYLAFLLKAQPFESMSTGAMYGLVAAAAGVGSFTGAALGSMLRSRGPEPVIVGLLLLETLAVTASALWYGVVSVALVAAVAGFSQSLGKLALDALLQRDIDENRRASVFARTETLLQLTWVLGGFAGILLTLWGSLGGDLGLATAALALVVALAAVLRALAQSRQQRRASAALLKVPLQQ